MNWLKRLFHTCETPHPDTFAPIEGKEWICPECKDVWIYEGRLVEVEVTPAVWDRWADIQKETVVAWWKKGK